MYPRGNQHVGDNPACVSFAFGRRTGGIWVCQVSGMKDEKQTYIFLIRCSVDQ